AMNLVEMIETQPVLDVAIKLGAAEITARAQFVTPQVLAQGNIHVNFIHPSLGVAVDVHVRVGSAETFGVEINRVRVQREDGALPSVNILKVRGGPDGPSVHAIVNQACRPGGGYNGWR